MKGQIEMAKRKTSSSPPGPKAGESESDEAGERSEDAEAWPVVKLTLQPNIFTAIQAGAQPNESVQHWIIRHLASHFQVAPIIRHRGQRSRPPQDPK